MILPPWLLPILIAKTGWNNNAVYNRIRWWFRKGMWRKWLRWLLRIQYLHEVVWQPIVNRYWIDSIKWRRSWVSQCFSTQWFWAFFSFVWVLWTKICLWRKTNGGQVSDIVNISHSYIFYVPLKVSTLLLLPDSLLLPPLPFPLVLTPGFVFLRFFSPAILNRVGLPTTWSNENNTSTTDDLQNISIF